MNLTTDFIAIIIQKTDNAVWEGRIVMNFAKYLFAAVPGADDQQAPGIFSTLTEHCGYRWPGFFSFVLACITLEKQPDGQPKTGNKKNR